MRPLATALSLCLGLLGSGAARSRAHGAGGRAAATLFVSPTGDDSGGRHARRSAADAAGGRRPAGLRWRRTAAARHLPPHPDRAARSSRPHRRRDPTRSRPSSTSGAWCPSTASRASCRSRTARRITVRGLDIRGYRTTSMAKVPIGIYVTGHGSRITLAHNHVHRMGNDNPTLGSFDINAHGIAVYGRSPSRPITRLRIRDNEVDHLHLGASESVVVNGNVTRWRITGNHIHDDNNIGIDAIGWEGTVPGRHRYAAVDQARRGVIAGNTVSRIISRGNPSYWEGDGWCNCADGIYLDGAGHVDVRDNVVRTSDIGIEVGRGEPARPRRRRPRTPQPGQRQRVRRSRARWLQPEPRRGVRRAGHRQPLPRRQHPAGRLTGAAAAVQAARDVDRRATPWWPRIAPHPLLLQRNRLVGPRRLNAHVRLDHNRYVAPVRASRAAVRVARSLASPASGPTSGAAAGRATAATHGGDSERAPSRGAAAVASQTHASTLEHVQESRCSRAEPPVPAIVQTSGRPAVVLRSDFCVACGRPTSVGWWTSASGARRACPGRDLQPTRRPRRDRARWRRTGTCGRQRPAVTRLSRRPSRRAG